MARKYTDDLELLLEAHRKGVEQAIDLSIRTGVPLVVEENGVIKEVHPKYKYIKVPIRAKKTAKKLSQSDRRDKSDNLSLLSLMSLTSLWSLLSLLSLLSLSSLLSL